MTTFGLVSTGFNSKPLETTLSEIEAAERATIDPLIGTSAEDPVGQLNAIMALKLTELWDLAAAAYAARDPANATLAQLDSMSALTGTGRRAPTKGSVLLTLGVLPGYTVRAGSVAGVPGAPESLWVTLSDAVVPIGGPAVPVDVIVSASALIPGVILAPADTITAIMTPVSGWSTVTNASDATPGKALETDPELRARRERELTAQGGAQIEAIREGVLALEWIDGRNIVVAAIVDENASGYADAYGRPPHSIECVLQIGSWVAGLSVGDQAAVAQLLALAMWRLKPGGISYYGTDETTAIVDSQGVARSISYNDASNVPVYMTVAVTVNPTLYQGDTALKDTIEEWGLAFILGQDVIRNALLCTIMDVPGVIDCTTLTIGLGTAVKREQNIAIDRRSLATFDTSNMVVSHV